MVTRLGVFRLMELHKNTWGAMKIQAKPFFPLSKIAMAMAVPSVPATGHTAGLYVGATRTGYNAK